MLQEGKRDDREKIFVLRQFIRIVNHAMALISPNAESAACGAGGIHNSFTAYHLRNFPDHHHKAMPSCNAYMTRQNERRSRAEPPRDETCCTILPGGNVIQDLDSYIHEFSICVAKEPCTETKDTVVRSMSIAFDHLKSRVACTMAFSEIADTNQGANSNTN